MKMALVPVNLKQEPKSFSTRSEKERQNTVRKDFGQPSRNVWNYTKVSTWILLGPQKHSSWFTKRTKGQWVHSLMSVSFGRLSDSESLVHSATKMFTNFRSFIQQHATLVKLCSGGVENWWLHRTENRTSPEGTSLLHTALVSCPVCEWIDTDVDRPSNGREMWKSALTRPIVDAGWGRCRWLDAALAEQKYRAGVLEKTQKVSHILAKILSFHHSMPIVSLVHQSGTEFDRL